jgi:hypothetical protein
VCLADGVKIVQTYPADITCGVIGVTPECKVDYPGDNVFHIALDRLPRAEESVILSYQLKGILEAAHAGKSINAHLTHGGLTAVASDDWTVQTEQVDPRQLREGLNIIRFTLASDAGYAYEVRVLELQYVQLDQVPSLLRLHQESPSSFDRTGYVSGFIDHRVLFPKVLLDGMETPLHDRQIESIISECGE